MQNLSTGLKPAVRFTPLKECAWPPGSKKFTIHPQSGKKRGEGNGVGLIRLGL